MTSKLKTAISAAGLVLALNSCTNHQDPKTVRLNDWIVTIYEDEKGRKNLRMHPENMDGDKCYIDAYNLHQYYNQRRRKYMDKFGYSGFHFGEDPVCKSRGLFYWESSNALEDIYRQAEKAEKLENK